MLNKWVIEGEREGFRFLYFFKFGFCLFKYFIGLNCFYYLMYVVYYKDLIIRGFLGMGGKYCEILICCYDFFFLFEEFGGGRAMSKRVFLLVFSFFLRGWVFLFSEIVVSLVIMREVISVVVLDIV